MGDGAEKPCGCQEGAAAVLAALALLLLQGAGVLDLPVVGSGLWSWVGLLFGAALLGKAIGIGSGELQLRRMKVREAANERL